MSPQSEEEKKQWSVSGLAIPAGAILGVGIGFLVDNIVAGVLIGVGAGFFMMMTIMFIFKLTNK